MQLDRDAAHGRARASSVARRASRRPAGRARGGRRSRCENIANAIRLLTIERGIDPRELRARRVRRRRAAARLRRRRRRSGSSVSIDPAASRGSARRFGAAIAPLRVDRVWSLGVAVGPDRREPIVRRQLRGRRGGCPRRARARRRRRRRRPSSRAIACRYYLQNYEEEVPSPDLGAGLPRARGRRASTGSTRASTATPSPRSRSSSSTAGSRRSSALAGGRRPDATSNGRRGRAASERVVGERRSRARDADRLAAGVSATPLAGPAIDRGGRLDDVRAARLDGRATAPRAALARCESGLHEPRSTPSG